MSKLPILAVAAALGLAACGGDDDGTSARTGAPTATAEEGEAATTSREREPGTTPRERKGTRITLGDSEFGRMLFDDRRQAIYIFENDRPDESVCYDDCAEAWPPVLTRGEPRAADGVRASLLGTTERRDGRRQVTYDGKPLYFYAHEAPGEVRCHNVDLNGGFWWVVGRDGERRP